MEIHATKFGEDLVKKALESDAKLALDIVSCDGKDEVEQCLLRHGFQPNAVLLEIVEGVWEDTRDVF